MKATLILFISILLLVGAASCKKDKYTEDMVIKNWEVYQMIINNDTLGGSPNPNISTHFYIKADGTFDRSPIFGPVTGTWNLISDGEKLEFVSSDTRVYKILGLDNELVIEYEDNNPSERLVLFMH